LCSRFTCTDLLRPNVEVFQLDQIDNFNNQITAAIVDIPDLGGKFGQN
jgi:hypothetical protein